MTTRLVLPQPFIVELPAEDGTTQMEVVRLIKRLPNGYLASRSDGTSIVIPYAQVDTYLDDTSY